MVPKPFGPKQIQKTFVSKLRAPTNLKPIQQLSSHVHGQQSHRVCNLTTSEPLVVPGLHFNTNFQTSPIDASNRSQATSKKTKHFEFAARNDLTFGNQIIDSKRLKIEDVDMIEQLA